MLLNYFIIVLFLIIIALLICLCLSCNNSNQIWTKVGQMKRRRNKQNVVKVKL